jgi:hypothetical protein
MEVFEEGGPINRGEACRLMFALLEQDDAR